MDERVKQQSNEWVVKLTLISLSIILVAGLVGGGYVGYLYYRLYHEHDAEALRALYKFGFRNFREVNLRDDSLWKASLKGVDLQHANLQRTFLKEVPLEGADLQHANLKDAYLPSSNLKDANLRLANLDGAEVTPLQLSKCQSIEGVIFLPKDFLLEVERINSQLVRSWWHKHMVKEIDQDGWWTGRWIEPPKNQADKQSER